MYKPKVSIIIPVYNGAQYLGEDIESAISQTYEEKEIIVVDDGSNDGGDTQRVAKEYEKKIRYIYKQNGGVSDALNWGIRGMKGEWFSWLSHDDLYYPDKIQKQVRFLNEIVGMNTNADIQRNVIFCFSELIDTKGHKIIRLRQGHNKNTARLNLIMSNLRRNDLNGCTFLFPKKGWVQLDGFDVNYRTKQDKDFWHRLLFAGYEFYCLPKVLVKTRIHALQTTFQSTMTMYEEDKRFYQSLIEKISENSLDNNGHVFFKIGCYTAYKGLNEVSAAAFKKAKSISPYRYNRIIALMANRHFRSKRILSSRIKSVALLIRLKIRFFQVFHG